MKQPILISAGKDGLIVMKFSGDLLDADLPFFKTGLDIGKAVIARALQASGKKVRIILDMTDFTGKYSAEGVEMLADFAKNNKDFVEKTASFGGSDSVKAVGEIVTALAGRDNIKIFATEKEALEWLGK